MGSLAKANFFFNIIAILMILTDFFSYRQCLEIDEIYVDVWVMYFLVERGLSS